MHEVGSSDKELAVIIKDDSDKILFQPFFVTKDLMFVLIILFFFVMVVGFYPNYLGHPDNYIPADPLVTPAHIVPE